MRTGLRLPADIRAAGGGLLGLIGGRPGWETGFDFSSAGFVLSFAGPLLALPLYVLAVAMAEPAATGAASGSAGLWSPGLWSAGLAHLIDAFGFPLLLAAIAGPLRVKPGYAGFVIVNNWAALYLNLILALGSLLTLLGPDGTQAFDWLTLLLLVASVALVWRIAWETLTRELAVAVLVVVASVAWGAFADVAARRLVGG